MLLIIAIVVAVGAVTDVDLGLDLNYGDIHATIDSLLYGNATGQECSFRREDNNFLAPDAIRHGVDCVVIVVVSRIDHVRTRQYPAVSDVNSRSNTFLNEMNHGIKGGSNAAHSSLSLWR